MKFQGVNMELVQLVVSLGVLNREFGRGAFTGVDASDWSIEDVRATSETVAREASAAGIRLESVEVGPDILERMGGASHFFDNARNDNGVIYAAKAESGRLVFVLGPQ